MAGVYEKFVSWVLPRELDDTVLKNTSWYDFYEDESQNEQIFSHLGEEL